MRHARYLATLAVALSLPVLVSGQSTLFRDTITEPTPILPTPKPLPEVVVKHRQAMRLFLQAKCLEKEMRLTDAARVYGEALVLEPKATAIRKALIPVCFALDQDVEAIQHCRAVLDLDPEDGDVLLRYAGAMEECNQPGEAANALQRALATPVLRDRHVLRAQIGSKLGAFREELRQYDQAMAAFADVIAALKKPEVSKTDHEDALPLRRELAKAHERLAHVAVLAGKFDVALKVYEEAAKEDPARAGRIEYHLAKVHLARHDSARAFEHLRRYVATRPGGIEAYEALVQVLRDLGRANEITAILEQARQQDPYNQALKFFHAHHLAEVGKYPEAERIYLASLEEFPSEEATRGLLHLYNRQGRWSEVVRRLDQTLSDPRQLPAAREIIQILDAEPDLAKGVARAAGALPQGGQQLAYQTRRVLTTIARQNELLELAEQFCRTCLQDDPQPGDAYLELCRILSAAEKHEAEVAVCREALAKELKVPGHVFRGELVRALSRAERHAEALATAEEGQRLAETNEEKYQAGYALAIAQFRAHQADKAVATAKQLLAEIDDPRRQRQMHYLLSSIHGAQKNHAEAERHLQEVLDIDPEDATACNDLGYVWADQCKNLEEAERLIRKALELDRVARSKRGKTLEKRPAEEDNAAYVDSLGWVLYRRGRLDDARKELERASRLPDGQKDPVVWEHLGQVHGDLGQLPAARAAYERALQLLATGKRPDAAERRQEVQRLLQALKEPATAKP